MSQFDKLNDARLTSQIQPGAQDCADQNNQTRAEAAGANTGKRVPTDQEASTFDTGASKDVIK